MSPSRIQRATLFSNKLPQGHASQHPLGSRLPRRHWPGSLPHHRRGLEPTCPRWYRLPPQPRRGRCCSALGYCCAFWYWSVLCSSFAVHWRSFEHQGWWRACCWCVRCALLVEICGYGGGRGLCLMERVIGVFGTLCIYPFYVSCPRTEIR
jgi:hypothetical protein